MRKDPPLFLIGLFFIPAYFLAGTLGLALANANTSVSVIWPASGLALFVLLVYGYTNWPLIWFAAFLVNVTTTGDIPTSVTIASGNTAEALLGAWLLNNYAGGTNFLDQSRSTIRFLLLAGAVSTTIAASVGTMALAFGGLAPWQDFGLIWLTWWLGDATGVILLAPLLLVWQSHSMPRLTLRAGLRTTAIILLIVGISVIQFGVWLPHDRADLPLLFLGFPFMIWMALRYSERDAISTASLLCALAVYWTWRGFGPFAAIDLKFALFLLQSYVGTIAILTLILVSTLLERKQAEAVSREMAVTLDDLVHTRTAELEKANRNLRHAQEQAHIGSWEWDISSDTVIWSDELYKIVGIGSRPEPPRFDEYLMLVHPDDRHMVRHSVEQSLRSGDPFSFDHRVVRPDGSERILHSVGKFQRDDEGEPLRLFGTAQDVTSERKLEEQIRIVNSDLELRVHQRTAELVQMNLDLQNEKRKFEEMEIVQAQLAAIVEHADNAIISMDLDGMIRSWNNGAKRIYGYDFSEVVGHSGSMLLPGELRQELARLLGRVMAGEPIEPFDVAQIKKDGTQFDAHVIISPIKSEKGKIIGASKIAYDITEKNLQIRRMMHLAHAVESAGEIITITDVNNKFVFVNKAFTEEYRYAAEEIIGSVPDILRPDTASGGGTSELVLQQTLRGGWSGELLNQRKDGTVFPIQLTTSPILDAEGKVVGFVGVAQNISERKIIEQKLRQSEEQYRLISENVADMIAVHATDGKRLYMSPSYKSLLGDPQSLLGRDPFADIHPDDREKIQTLFRETVESGIGKRSEHRILAQDGTIRFVESQGSTILGQDGRAAKVIVVSRDITARKKAEELLRRSEQQLANVIGSAMDAVITINEQHRIMLFNASAERMFGIRSADAIGMELDRFLPGRFRAIHRVHVEKFSKTNVTKRTMGSLRAIYGLRANGEEFPIEASISQVTVSDQKLYTVILRDITERKRAEVALLEAERQFRKLYSEILVDGVSKESTIDESISEDSVQLIGDIASSILSLSDRMRNSLKNVLNFTSLASHELRTPLALLRRQLEELMNDSVPLKTFRRALITMYDDILRLNQTVNTLLSISAIYAGTLVLVKKEVNLCVFLEEFCNEVFVLAEESGVHLIREDGPRAELYVDADKLRQVLLNLFDNALKHTPARGSIMIRHLVSGKKVLIQVSDTGTGIPSNSIKTIFQPFTTVKQANGQQGGTGLGLAFAKLIVKEHGGEISIDSVFNRGTSVSIFLPLS